MATVLEELVTVLGFEIDDDDLVEYQKKLDGTAASLKKVSKWGLAAAAGISAYITLVASAVDRQFKFSQAAGSSFQELQRIGHAAGIAGASVSDVESSFARLNVLASQAARGQIPEAFAFLGINAREANGRLKTSRELFDEIADRIAGMKTPQEQADFAGALGFSTEMILLLRMGSREIGRLGAELESVGAVLTDAQGRRAEKFMDQMLRARAVFKGIGNDIAIYLMPRLGDAADKFFEWGRANRELIETNVEKWLERATTAMRPLALGIGAIVLGMAIMALGPVLIAAKWVAMGAAIGLVIDDILAHFEGKDSVTSKILDSFEDLGPSLKLIWDQMQGGFSTSFSGESALGAGGAAPGGVGMLPPRLSALAGAASIAGGGVGTVNQENNFIISSTDPAGVAREVAPKMDETARTIANLRSPTAS